MFTDQAQQLLDQAKMDARARGEASLALGSLLAAVRRHTKARVLLGRCTGMAVDELRDPGPVPQPRDSLLTGKIAVSSEVRAILGKARELALEVPDRYHPGLVDVRHLVGALAMSRQACAELGGKPVSAEKVVADLAAWYDMDAEIPELGALSDQLRALRTELLSRVFGQDHAVQAFVGGLFNAEVTAYADVTRKSPRAIFVFAGPPGVGKTYLSELGASYLGRPFKRFDMTSYSDHQTYMQLVGFPPSYQSAQPGALTGFVANNPDAILLFDEIEKAHQNTVQLFLQILDAGRLEDKFTGEDVPFRDTLIIFTTNAGASLYDRPNETGVHAANATFHRRTILDALRTEHDARGQPFFPPAICSRLATGYPVLFNHLGINELERIARSELVRVAGLIEQQYYKSVTFDDLLPLALVLREGANTDARTVRSQSSIFLKTELFKFSGLYTRERLEGVMEQVDSIRFGIDPKEFETSTVAGVFQPTAQPTVLLVAGQPLGELFERRIAEIDWLTASTAQDALQVLASEDVDMVLLDIWLGRDQNTLTRSFTGTIDDFDHVPVASRALAEGQTCLQAIHERLPTMPVFLISLPEADDGPGAVDEELFLACVRAGGARGTIETTFTTDAVSGWEEARDRLVQKLQHETLRMYREQQARSLGEERKVLAFDTAPAIDRGSRQVNVRLRNLRLSRAIAAEDADEILEDVERPRTRFSDVFGADTAKEALRFVVDWLHDPRHYAALGVQPPKGILLTGPPGTGKTMLARALAGESDVAFLVASGTDFVTIWQGSGPQNVRDLFRRARRYAPSILFIDEIDAIGKRRTGSVGGGRAEESTLNALLTEMDGFGGPTTRPVIMLAATNMVENLDDALLRRFDRTIEVPPPDRAARAAYLRHELLERQSSQVSEGVVESLAGRSARMTIAQLRRIINEAAVMAARQGSVLTAAIVEEAFEKMQMGEAKRMQDPDTLKRIARHEAGHALISWLTGTVPVQVTIVGRGGAGGYVEKEIDEEKIIFTRRELEYNICQAMGGRAAELLYYGDGEGLSTGVGSDLRHATAWAERMVGEFGMSEEIGQIFYDPRHVQDGPRAAKVSEVAEGIVRTQLDKALDLLKEYQAPLDRLVDELIDKNRLTRPEVERLLADIPQTLPP